MGFEKRGVIEEGRTPPENDSKQASHKLEDHTTKRLADKVQETCVTEDIPHVRKI
jgi:hypothetical protein